MKLKLFILGMVFISFVGSSNGQTGNAKRTPVTPKAVQTEVKRAPENSIESIWTEITNAIKRIPDDPFDKALKDKRASEILNTYSGREILIPVSSYQQNDQKIYPLQFREEKLSFYISDADELDQATAYVTYFLNNSGSGKVANNGRSCTVYQEKSGYAAAKSFRNLGRIETFMLGDNNVVKYTKENLEMTTKLSVDEARRLSGDLDTYVVYSEIEHISETGDSSSFTMNEYGSCKSGWMRYLHGKLSSIIVKRRSTKEAVLQVRFSR